MYETQNQNVIRRMVKADLKAEKRRNLFVALTVFMAAAMLAIMGLLPGSIRLETQRALTKSQHAIYMDLNAQQMEALQDDDRISYLTWSKQGESMELDGYTISRVYYDSGSRDIQTMTIEEGRAPEKENEVAVPKAYLEKLGVEPALGVRIEIPSLSGEKETCTVSGFYEFAGNNNYLIVHSKAYAENGRVLKAINYDALVRFAGAEQMSQDQFEETFTVIGKDAGIAREKINPHNTFWGTLPDGIDVEVMTIAGIGALILIAGIMVIYSVFYISIAGKTREYGQLRTLGMTKRQVKKLVRRQGLILALMTAPAGAVLGAAIAGILKPGGFSILRSLVAAVIVILVILIVVRLAVMRPARIAATVSPMEAVRYTAYQDDGKDIGTGGDRLQRRLTPMRLAGMNVMRNRKKTFVTVISLGLSGMLFIGAATFMASFDQELFFRQGEFRVGEFVLHFSENAVQQEKNGEAELQLEKNSPFTADNRARIEAIPGVKQVQERKRADVWYQYGDREDANDSICPFSREDAKELQQNLTEGAFSYDEMLSGDKVLIANNNVADEIFGEPFKIGETVTLAYWDGEKKVRRDYEIIGACDGGDFNLEAQYSGWFMVPDQVLESQNPGVNLISEWVISTGGQEEKGETARQTERQVEQHLKAVLQQNPLLSMGTLQERRENDEKTVMHMMILIMGLALFITLFSLMNLVNTLITNFLSQKNEFAMLQSIGMTGEQLKKLVIGEGVYLAAGNIVISLILGSAAGFGLCKYMFSTGAKYMSYQFPLWYVLGYCLVVLLVPCIIAAVEIRKFKNQSMIERLREV